MLQARFQRALASLAEWRFAPRSCAAWRILIKSGDLVVLAGIGVVTWDLDLADMTVVQSILALMTVG